VDQAKKKKINEAKANGLPPPPSKKKNVKPPKKCSTNNIVKETDYELQDPIEETNKSQGPIEETNNKLQDLEIEKITDEQDPKSNEEVNKSDNLENTSGI